MSIITQNPLLIALFAHDWRTILSAWVSLLGSVLAASVVPLGMDDFPLHYL